MNRKRIQEFIALIMVFALIIGLVPAGNYKAEANSGGSGSSSNGLNGSYDSEGYYLVNSWQGLQTAINNGISKIKLNDSITAGSSDSPIVVNKLTTATSEPSMTASGSAMTASGSAISATGAAITIDLGGHTIDRGLHRNDAQYNGFVLKVASGASLEIKNGTIEGGHNTENGGGIRVEGGTLLMENVKLFNNGSEKNGGGIYIENGRLSIKNTGAGTTSGITDNFSYGDKGGGGIYVGKGCNEIILDNCDIAINHAKSGTGIYAEEGNVLKITGKSCINSYTDPYNYNTIAGIYADGRITIDVSGLKKSTNTASNNRINFGGDLSKYEFKGINNENLDLILFLDHSDVRWNSDKGLFEDKKKQNISVDSDKIDMIKNETAKIEVIEAVGTVDYIVEAKAQGIITVATNGAIEAIGVGPAIVTVYAEETEEYKRSNNISVKVTVYEGTSTLTATPAAITGITYDGRARELIQNAGTATNGTVFYKLEKVGSNTSNTSAPEFISNDGSVVDDWKENASDIKATDAGSYKVWYAVLGNSNYKHIEPQSIDVIIAMADQSITASDINMAYGGEKARINVSGDHGTVRYEVTEGTDVISVDTSGNITANKAGTAKVKVTASGNDNYKASDELTVTVTVNKGTPSMTATPAAITEIKYDNQEHVLINAGTATNGKVYYKLEKVGSNTSNTSTPAFISNDCSVVNGWKENASDIKATDAGTYRVWYAVKGNTGYNNINPQSIDVTIARANQNVTVANSVMKGFSEGSYNVTVSGIQGNAAKTFTSSSSEVATVDNNGKVTFIKDGNVTITLNVAETVNYNSCKKTISLTINKSDVTSTAPTSKELTYNESEHVLINAGTVTNGTMYYKLEESNTVNSSTPVFTGDD
nr:Ig-like domain-containing protein [Lachnospiraceae bacterium]